MKLVEEGGLDLDRPVSTYLTRWQLPRGAFDNDGVTARRLLGHTSGLTDGLGFGDYQPHEEIPPLEESLSRPRASDGRTVQIAVGREPGADFDYSGGGYLLLQLIVEEVSGQRFEDYMRSEVLEPLGLTRSTFEYIGDASNVSPSYDAQGQRAPLYRYAASGATGYSTSAADLATFVMAQLPEGLAGRPLSQATIDRMREPHAFLYRAAIWGLGTMLFAPTPSGDFVFGHDGANEPAINAAGRVNPDTGDGIVVLASGNPTLASKLGFEWVFWQTGKPDFLGVGAELERSLPLLAAGGLLVVALAFIVAWRLRRRATRGGEPATPDGAH
jgi:CubicO group peptidase (beta-lactamase class C family)